LVNYSHISSSVLTTCFSRCRNLILQECQQYVPGCLRTERAFVSCSSQQAATGGSSQMLPHLNHSPGRGRTTTSRTAAPCKGPRVDAGHHVRGSVRDEASCRLRPGIKDCREECAPTVNFTCLLWSGCGAGWQIRAFHAGSVTSHWSL
jgi:hypothetical protein